MAALILLDKIYTGSQPSSGAREGTNQIENYINIRYNMRIRNSSKRNDIVKSRINIFWPMWFELLFLRKERKI